MVRAVENRGETTQTSSENLLEELIKVAGNAQRSKPSCENGEGLT